MKFYLLKLIVLFAYPVLMTPVESSAAQWTQFRGSSSNGTSKSKFPSFWGETENVLWKVPVAGEGWSSPVVWDQQVFLTTAVRIDPAGANDTGPEVYRGGGGQRRSDLMRATYSWKLLCLDAKTGKIRWQQTAHTGPPPMPRHSSNTYATETPVTDGQRVYAYFGMVGVFCYDMRGNPLWQRSLGAYEMRAGWGTASSPVLFEDKLFLQVDNEQESFVVAIAADTGQEIWRVARKEPSQYSSPVIWQNSLRNELIVGGQVYRSYDPTSGKLLWELDMDKGRSSATPLAVGDRLYVGTEFRNRGGSDDGGGFLFAVIPGGSGDITPPAGTPSSDHVIWKIERSGIQMASPALADGHLYLLERRSGILHCLDAETGASAYRTRVPARGHSGLPHGQAKDVYSVWTTKVRHMSLPVVQSFAFSLGMF